MIPETKSQIFKVAWLLVSLCLYLPFSWLLFVGNASAGYRLTWLKLWPILPGFLPGIWLLHPNDVAEMATMGATTVALLLGLTWLGTGGRGRLTTAMGLALLVSIPSSLLALAVFRA